jgi:flagellar basal-body rod modification protein FlgD
MGSPISSLTNSNASANASQTSPAANNSTQMMGEDVFLKLFISQLKNQDPLNPADGMSFVTQLAQFSQLETLFGIRGDLQAVLAQNTQPSSTTPASSTPSGGTTTGVSSTGQN